MREIPLTTASLTVASIAMLPFLPPPPPVEAFSTAVVIALLGVSIVCSAFAFLLYFRLIADLGPTRAATVTFIIPVFGVLWGCVFLDETIASGTIAGGLTVLAATGLVVRR